MASTTAAGVVASTPYQATIAALAARAGLAAVQLAFEARPRVLPVLFSVMVSRYASRATAVADVAVAGELTRLTGRPIPAVGVTIDPGLAPRIAEAVRTIQATTPDDGGKVWSPEDFVDDDPDAAARATQEWLREYDMRSLGQNQTVKDARRNAARLRRLAKAETMSAAQTGARKAMVSRRVPGWRRRVNAGACPLCSGFPDVVMPMTVTMATHPGCGCIQLPVLTTATLTPAEKGE